MGRGDDVGRGSHRADVRGEDEGRGSDLSLHPPPPPDPQGPITHDVIARALSSIISGTPSLPPGRVPSPFDSVLEAATAAYLNRDDMQAALASARAKWDAEGPFAAAHPCPALFLYSNADTLMYPHDIEEFQEIQRTAGRTVYAKRWSGSAHVAHLREHPFEYEAEVRKFIDAVSPPASLPPQHAPASSTSSPMSLAF